MNLRLRKIDEMNYKKEGERFIIGNFDILIIVIEN